jgi:hypothetical protein
MKTLSRNPFGRYDVVSESVKTGNHAGCDWCGALKVTRCGTYLYRYGTQPDDKPGRAHWLTGLFCGKSCAESFHGPIK